MNTRNINAIKKGDPFSLISETHHVQSLFGFFLRQSRRLAGCSDMCLSKRKFFRQRCQRSARTNAHTIYLYIRVCARA